MFHVRGEGQLIEEMGHTRELGAHVDEVMTGLKRAVMNIQASGYCMVRAFYMPVYVNGHVPGDERYEFHELLDRAVKEILQFPNIYDIDATVAGELPKYCDNGDRPWDAVIPALVRVTATICKINIFDRQIIRVKTLEPNGPPDTCIELLFRAYKRHYDSVCHIPGMDASYLYKYRICHFARMLVTQVFT